MPLSKERVFKILRDNQSAIRRFGVRKLSLFGSCARGRNAVSSDLDFLVVFDKKSFDTYMGLKEFLEGLFSCHVDLVLTNTIKPRLRARILREAVHAAGL